MSELDKEAQEKIDPDTDLARLLLNLWCQKIDILQAIIRIKELGYRKPPNRQTIQEIQRGLKEISEGKVEPLSAIERRFEKPPDRAKLREKIAEELYYQSFRPEARDKVTPWEALSLIIRNHHLTDADQILALFELPKERPPLLTNEKIGGLLLGYEIKNTGREISNLEFVAYIAKAQWEADIQHYGERRGDKCINKQ